MRPTDYYCASTVHDIGNIQIAIFSDVHLILLRVMIPHGSGMFGLIVSSLAA
jgi:hypothetical protein